MHIFEAQRPSHFVAFRWSSKFLNDLALFFLRSFTRERSSWVEVSRRKFAGDRSVCMILTTSVCAEYNAISFVMAVLSFFLGDALGFTCCSARFGFCRNFMSDTVDHGTTYMFRRTDRDANSLIYFV